ncbi:Protein FAR1-RELATED SEQUENCE 5 [Rhynchospora pubera]|uniref:Protein FAR1-RELATED SEQUENCE n=1 Tax=Rhynchospora pubera TaxID=906938 RepID=A0AAV8C4K0_9POAL|nr:Protein FAR1-RELATED SEQUENCE 5 [Rhynchospora pubera]
MKNEIWQVSVFFRSSGRENLRFKKKDVCNKISKFFYEVDLDDDGVVRNMFWVDGRGRRSYQEFRDVVTFDTTYNTNKYSMPFAPFIGVNHHRQSILFESIYQRESDEDLRSINEIPHIKTRYVIEVEGRRVYTRSVFAFFRELVLESTIGSVREIERDAKYEVIIKFHPFIKNWIPDTYAVEVDIPTERFFCNCKGFECEGLLCSHAIKVMQHVGFLNLQDHYVLKRWTKDANVVSKITSSHKMLEIGESQQLEEHRIATLKGEFNKLAVIGSKSAELFSRMKCRIDDLKGEFVETIESDKESYSVSDEIPCIEEVPKKVYDPYVSQCKGKRKNPTRFKPTADVGVKKRRRCKVCKKIAGHNARTCPLVIGDK